MSTHLSMRRAQVFRVARKKPYSSISARMPQTSHVTAFESSRMPPYMPQCGHMYRARVTPLARFSA